MVVAKDEIKTVYNETAEYPELLNQIENPPEKLYYTGKLELGKTRCLAIVGSRKATAYGKWAAYNIAKRAADHDITIVSGLARGVDSYAHKGALDAGGNTIAVLGCGIDICYPKENKSLMKAIAKKGLVISEYPIGSTPLRHHFPLRNRIISGLSETVVVVEASLNSGSLITADYALNQGREVFAVPGNINNILSIGSNKLIQDGATPIVVIDDILEAFSIKERKEIELTKDERIILRFIKEHGEITTSYLSKISRKPASVVSDLVTNLEMKGKVQTSSDKIYIAKF
ncbi:MAG: DNA-protecting protein DprA [Clostridiales bacterium]|nr:DNA-protecting protein DprA [Clostridiales bacterium]